MSNEWISHSGRLSTPRQHPRSGKCQRHAFSQPRHHQAPGYRQAFSRDSPSRQGQTLRAIVVRADDPAFRPGQIMIMNFAREILTADLGGEKLTFQPGSHIIFRPQRKNDLSHYQVRFYQAKEDKPKVFAATLWPYFDNKRAFVFLYIDPTSGFPTFRAIDEFTDWLKN